MTAVDGVACVDGDHKSSDYVLKGRRSCLVCSNADAHTSMSQSPDADAKASKKAMTNIDEVACFPASMKVFQMLCGVLKTCCRCSSILERGSSIDGDRK